MNRLAQSRKNNTKRNTPKRLSPPDTLWWHWSIWVNKSCTNTTTTKLLKKMSQGANEELEESTWPRHTSDYRFPTQNLKFRGCYWWCIRCGLGKFDFRGVTDRTICYWFLSTTCSSRSLLLSQLKLTLADSFILRPAENYSDWSFSKYNVRLQTSAKARSYFVPAT